MSIDANPTVAPVRYLQPAGAFHDDFMKQGTAPLKILRKAMLGDDLPTL